MSLWCYPGLRRSGVGAWRSAAGLEGCFHFLSHGNKPFGLLIISPGARTLVNKVKVLLYPYLSFVCPRTGLGAALPWRAMSLPSFSVDALVIISSI